MKQNIANSLIISLNIILLGNGIGSETVRALMHEDIKEPFSTSL